MEHGPNLDLHYLSFFFLEHLINLRDVLVRELLDIVFAITLIVFGDIAGLLGFAKLRISFATCISDGNAGILGISSGTYDLFGWFKAMGDGILSMGELIIITMLAGGLLEIVRENGGIDFVIQRLTQHVHGKRGAELAIGFLVAVVDICTANNTVAIITVGGIAKQIGDRYGVDNRKAASILDTFSCAMQGIIPYGAQLLMAAGLASLNPVQIMPYLYYPFAIGIAAVLAVILRYPKRYS